MVHDIAILFCRLRWLNHRRRESDQGQSIGVDQIAEFCFKVWKWEPSSQESVLNWEWNGFLHWISIWIKFLWIGIWILIVWTIWDSSNSKLEGFLLFTLLHFRFYIKIKKFIFICWVGLPVCVYTYINFDPDTQLLMEEKTKRAVTIRNAKLPSL